MTTLAAAAVITPEGTVSPGAVDVEGGRIAAVRRVDPPVPERTLVPGFIDLQVNGHSDVDVASADGEAWDRLDRLLLDQGVTTWCPTLVTAPLADYAARFERVERAAARPPDRRPAIAGIHIEGPFLGGAPGAHPREHICGLDQKWLDSLPELVRIVTLAPEIEGAPTAISALAERGVLVSLGHSVATFEEATAAADAGARLVTHLFNGMGPFHHRAPGLAGAGLTDPRLVTAVIADGVHLHPAAVKTAFRAKGRGGVVLVTDAVAWRARRLGRADVALRDGAPRLADGTIAGSALTMDAAIRYVVEQCGVGLDDAVAAAATTPASLLGLADRGRLAPGTRADVVALGPDLHIESVWVGGVEVD